MPAAILNYLWVLYPCIMIAAVYLNKDNAKSLLLLFSVALTFYLPVRMIENYYLWYAVVICAELLIIVLSTQIKCNASLPVLSITCLLLMSHITSLVATNTNLYGIIAKYLEHLQMLTFVVASPFIIEKLKRKLRCLV
jgi:hypothetical protein